MTQRQWMDLAKACSPQLSELIENWHPRNREPVPDEALIRQIAPETACEIIRGKIRARESHLKQNPSTLFMLALAVDDFDTVIGILNATWFGVPESTCCWSMRGFKECVDLLDDPPEQEEGASA